MIAIKCVLCPVDFSEAARHALEHAAALARWSGATLHVLHVIEVPGPVVGMPGAFYDLPGTARDQVEEQLRRLADSVSEGIEVDTTVRTGPVAPEILDAGEAVNADVLVVGTAGHSRFERFVLGSVAEKLISRSTRPVIAVPAVERHPAAVPPRKVLCAVDLSTSSATTLQHAAMLADRASEIILTSVVEWPFPDVDMRDPTDPLGQLRRNLEADTHERLLRLVETAGTPVTDVVVVSGRPRQQILRLARERAVDRIAMGTVGHGAIERAFLGSTTRQVLRESDCPVLAVPAQS